MPISDMRRHLLEDDYLDQTGNYLPAIFSFDECLAIEIDYRIVLGALPGGSNPLPQRERRTAAQPSCLQLRPTSGCFFTQP